jgi:preprotein translocase SecE subunit
LRKVAWPTPHQVRVLTVLVFGASLFVGFYIAFWDLLFTELLKLINPA